jgi:alpha-glucoside transport system substrate-binding protein
VNAGFGGVDTIASTQFNDVSTPIADGKCTFAREAANFDSNYEASQLGPDADVNAFYFPPANDQFGQTVLGGGTFYAAFTDRPEVQAFEYFVASPEYANARAQAGSYISANRGLQISSVESPIQQTALTTLQDPETVFRFDASDLMPAPVGSDAEWKQFTAWITGQDDATTLANIDAAWPAS